MRLCPKQAEDLKLITTKLFTYIITDFTLILQCPGKGGIAEKAAQLLIVLFPFSYTVVSDTDIKMSPSLQTRHVWRLVK